MEKITLILTIIGVLLTLMQTVFAARADARAVAEQKPTHRAGSFSLTIQGKWSR